MSGDDIGNLIYLVLLGTMIAGFFVARKRMSLNKALQAASVWGLIFLGVIAAYGLWGDISQTTDPQQVSF